jgi:hypothetical protein
MAFLKMQTANMQGEVADEVNRRLTKATRELEEKYARGEGGFDKSVNGPTGKAYKEQYVRDIERKKIQKQLKDQGNVTDGSNVQEGEKDEEIDGDDDEDYELRQIREQRMKKLQAAQREKIEHLGKGHGQYREIAQDEFLAEVTGSLRVICHFYHRDFPRCEIMHSHLHKLASRHIEAKFVKINAEKAPFFVNKLIIRTMPTVVLLVDGIAKDKIVGFEGLADDQPEGKEDEWPTVRLAKLLAAKDMLRKDLIVDEERVESTRAQQIQSLRQAMLSSALDEDDDLSD